jgi:hypothetical protein
MTSMRPAIAAAVLFALLVSASALMAAQGSRSVEGTVRDPSDQAVPGAIVKLKNMKTLQVRSYIADEKGDYQFHGLSKDIDYELKAEYSGRSSDSRTLSVFDNRSKAVINLKLQNK